LPRVAVGRRGTNPAFRYADSDRFLRCPLATRYSAFVLFALFVVPFRFDFPGTLGSG